MTLAKVKAKIVWKNRINKVYSDIMMSRFSVSPLLDVYRHYTILAHYNFKSIIQNTEVDEGQKLY